jgi:hypothetical protein
MYTPRGDYGDFNFRQNQFTWIISNLKNTNLYLMTSYWWLLIDCYFSNLVLTTKFSAISLLVSIRRDRCRLGKWIIRAWDDRDFLIKMMPNHRYILVNYRADILCIHRILQQCKVMRSGTSIAPNRSATRNARSRVGPCPPHLIKMLQRKHQRRWAVPTNDRNSVCSHLRVGRKFTFGTVGCKKYNIVPTWSSVTVAWMNGESFVPFHHTQFWTT